MSVSRTPPKAGRPTLTDPWNNRHTDRSWNSCDFMLFAHNSWLFTEMRGKKLKLSLSQAVEAHSVVRHRGSYIFCTIGSRMAVGCQPYAPAAFHSPKWFLVHISVRGWVRLEGLGKLKNSSDLIGNWIHDLPTCRIGPQPTTPPRAPFTEIMCSTLLNRMQQMSNICGCVQRRCWAM
jgi:hypothetical protein